MNTDECYTLLETAGWFDGWSAAARESARRTIDDNRQFREQVRFPGAGMVSAWGDCECVYEEGAYTQVVTEFGNQSHGFFEPTKIVEVWTDQGDGDFQIDISFECNSRSYARTLGYEGDWLDGGIFDLINEAMADGDPPMRFLQPDVGFGQEFGFLLVPESLIPALIEQELLPPLEEIEYVEAGESVEEAPITLLEFFELAEELQDPDLFEEEWGALPEHLVHFLRRDLGAFAESIAAGADVNATSSNGLLSALRISAYEDYSEGMEWLLAHAGVDLNQADPEGNTALSCAILEGRNERARQLIGAGADVQVINHAGVGLVGLARQAGNTEMAEVLAGLGAG